MKCRRRRRFGYCGVGLNAVSVFPLYFLTAITRSERRRPTCSAYVIWHWASWLRDLLTIT